jgi:hypothetical protein
MEENQPKIISLFGNIGNVLNNGYTYSDGDAYSANIRPRLQDQEQKRILGLPTIAFSMILVFFLIVGLYLYTRFAK